MKIVIEVFDFKDIEIEKDKNILFDYCRQPDKQSELEAIINITRAIKTVEDTGKTLSEYGHMSADGLRKQREIMLQQIAGIESYLS